MWTGALLTEELVRVSRAMEATANQTYQFCCGGPELHHETSFTSSAGWLIAVEVSLTAEGKQREYALITGWYSNTRQTYAAVCISQTKNMKTRQVH